MTIVFMVLFSFATYRATRFVIEDTMFEGTRLRFLLWLRAKDSMLAGKIADLLECPYCASVWLAGGLVVVTANLTTVPLPGLVWLASCGGTMMVWTITERPDG